MNQIADQAVRDRITAHGLHETLFVEAGAGSGKTTQLVERVVNLVLEGAPVTSIVAITFTEAAAAELRNRIRVSLERRANVLPAGDSSALILREALDALDQTAISTLHGFANRMLSEFPTEVGLPPRITVIDEITSQLNREQRWERFVSGLYDDSQHEDLLTRALALGVAIEPRYPGQASMKAVAQVLTDNWDRLEVLVRRQVEPCSRVVLQPTIELVQQLIEARNWCVNETDKMYQLIAVIEQWGHSLSPALPAFEAIAALKSCKKWRVSLGTKPNWGDQLDAVRQLVGDLNFAVEDQLRRVTNEVLESLLTLVAREVVSAAATRRSEGLLEFHDLLALARELLRTNGEVRRTLHHRYHHVLLDEFQDTDPIQIELAVLIASGVEVGRWSEAEIDPGRLFFVGDPKQSIYRFRRADIDLFMKARDVFTGSGDPATLSTNFRTVPEVVEWVNELFGCLMSEGSEGGQPAYTPLHAFRPQSAGTRAPIILGGEHDGLKANELRLAEAADVAAVISDIRHNPDAWPIGDGDAARPARLSDVTILLPTRTSLPQLLDALTGAEIPFRIATGTLVYHTQAIADLMAVMRAVGDTTDEISLVTSLRSPLYACTDVDLLEWRSAGGRWDYTRSRPHALSEEHPVNQAFDHLRELSSCHWFTGPSALLGRIIEDRRAELLACAHGRPHELLRHLRFVVDQARAFEDSGGSGLRAYLAWAELQSAEGSRVHEPMLQERGIEAVQIMTIHGAKGLEFPITILTGLTTQPAGARSGIKLIWDDNDVPSLQMTKDIKTTNHDPRADLEATLDEQERIRLLYVACTRARDHLIVSGHHSTSVKAKGTFAKRVWDTMATHALTRVWERPETLEKLPPNDVMPAPAASDGDWDVKHDQVVREFDALARRPGVVTSATAIARAAGESRVTAHDPARSEEGIEGDHGAIGGPEYRQGRQGQAVGTAVHSVLEHLDLASPVGIEDLVRRECSTHDIPDLALVVRGLVDGALQSEAVSLARRYPHYKEVYVAAPVGGRVIEGYVDLLIETPEGLIVVDYKTDAVSETEIDAKLAAYELQGATYALALESTTGITVRDCRFVFCRRGAAIERSVADLGSSMKRVSESLVTHLSA